MGKGVTFATAKTGMYPSLSETEVHFEKPVIILKKKPPNYFGWN
jgi:hypothetical protein